MLCKEIDSNFKKIEKRVQIVTKTLYNLHFYIEKTEIIHVIIYKWKYTNIVNSSNLLFLSELEEMKSSKYRVKNINPGMGL